MDGHVDAALQIHRAHPRNHRFRALMHNRLRENGCRGGTVAGKLAGLHGDLLQHLRADVLEPVGKLDFLRDRHPVLADPRGPERLVEKDVAALWPNVTLTASAKISIPRSIFSRAAV